MWNVYHMYLYIYMTAAQSMWLIFTCRRCWLSVQGTQAPQKSCIFRGRGTHGKFWFRAGRFSWSLRTMSKASKASMNICCLRSLALRKQKIGASIPWTPRKSRGFFLRYDHETKYMSVQLCAISWAQISWINVGCCPTTITTNIYKPSKPHTNLNQASELNHVVRRCWGRILHLPGDGQLWADGQSH